MAAQTCRNDSTLNDRKLVKGQAHGWLLTGLQPIASVREPSSKCDKMAYRMRCGRQNRVAMGPSNYLIDRRVRPNV